MADVAGVNTKIQGFLQALGVRATLESGNRISVRNGSSRGFIKAWSPKPDHPDSPTFVKFTVPLLEGVRESPELFEYIAFHADDYISGHLSLFRFDNGTLGVFFTHELLGDYIDAEEFATALFGVMKSADEIDDVLQARFGGERYHED